eukprot:Gb_13694 [translate_table: standard]
MDVKSAFLHGILDEKVYMRQPEGFVQVGQEHLVCRLKKDLYGLKQAPRVWYSRIDDYFISSRFTRCESDYSLYVKHEDGEILVVILYVDDLIITVNNTSQINYLKKQLSEAFEMSDLGLLHYYLGMEFWQKGDTIFVSQSKYSYSLLKCFHMEDSKPQATPMEVGLKLTKEANDRTVDGTLYRQLVGSLIYLTNTRPDISYVVGVVA